MGPIKVLTAPAEIGGGDPAVSWARRLALPTGRPVRCTVSRVLETLEGAPGIVAMAAVWWRNSNAMDAWVGKTGSMIRFIALVDEVRLRTHGDIGDAPLPAGAFKLLAAYRLPDSVDREAFWRYHIDSHAADFVAAAGPQLLRYTVNRRAATLAGSADFFACIEICWDSRAARDAYTQRAKSIRVASGLTSAQDFRARGAIIDFAAIVEETEIAMPDQAGMAIP